MKKFIVMMLLGVILITLLISYSDPLMKKESPPAKEGVIDLTSWDFNNDGIVRIIGEWEYYNGQLLTPEDFKENAAKQPKLTGYSKITTNNLNNIKQIHNKKNSIGTYRLIIKVDENLQYFGLKIDNHKVNFSNNRLYVNDKILDFSSNLSQKEALYPPNITKYEVYFPNDNEEMNLILQVSNNNQPFTLTTYNMTLGSQDDIQAQDIFIFAIELCGAALCFIIALYYMYLYYAGKKENGNWFSIVEFIGFSLILLFSGDRFLYQILSWFPFEFFIKIQNIALACIPYSIAGYTNITTDKVLPDRVFKVIHISFILYSLVILFTPYSFYVHLTHFIFIPILLIYITIIIRSVIMYRRNLVRINKYHSLLYIICLTCVIVNYSNNVLYNWGLVSSKVAGIIAIILFIILSQLFLAIRFTSNFNKMLEIEKMKDEFFIKSSYILNAPLNSISNISSSIINKIDGYENKKEEILNEAQMSKDVANGLIGIVNATLDVTLLQNNQLKLSDTLVDMKICIELAIKSMEKLVDNSRIHITINVLDSLLVQADEGRVRQIIHNLMSNSIYSMTKGTIIIKGEKKGGTAFISIEDNGCGIARELQDEIFNPYVTYQTEGIGLGLYISKQLAEHMGGKLYLEWSKLGKGSLFVLELPCLEGEYIRQDINSVKLVNKINPIIPLHKHKLPKKEQSKTILIVDDEIVNIHTAGEILQNNGYNIISAYSGDEALELIETVQVDLVILDIMMPATSGITTCKKIREKYSIIELPILLSTSISMNNDLDFGLLEKANDFISKPFMKKELSTRVKTLIALKTSIENASKSELAFLQAQIKPHFIYNTINTIISFCYTDGEKAAKLLTDFSKYLRLTFDIDNINMNVPVHREIDLIKAYVELQNARFGDRFLVEYDIEPKLLGKEIPSLIIQPLVENSIKHGFYQAEGLGYINVSISMINDNLVIAVQDTGIGMSKEKTHILNNMEYKDDGVGIWNIKKRIGRIKDATMDIQSKKNHGTMVTISIKM